MHPFLRRAGRGTPIWIAALGAATALAPACSGGDDAPSDPGPLEECAAVPDQIYRDRIEPLLVDENPKTCNQCHLSGVDMSLFVRATPCETMACLIDQNLVDLAAPESSRILSWIQRASPESELITADVIQAEYDGFLQWIESNASCRSACGDVECGEPDTADSCKNEDPPTAFEGAATGCTDPELEQLFYDDIYTWRGRCFPCHHSDQKNADPAAPRWLRTEGNCAAASLATMHQILERGLIDMADPTQSLLLLKPLSEVYGGVPHGGHEKFYDTIDPAYQSFLHFIQTYVDCKK